MVSISNLKKLSFLVYGLGLTVNRLLTFLKKKIKITKFGMILKKFIQKKRSKNISKTLQKVDYIILSPGINIQNINNKKIIKVQKK